MENIPLIIIDWIQLSNTILLVRLLFVICSFNVNNNYFVCKCKAPDLQSLTVTLVLCTNLSDYAVLLMWCVVECVCWFMFGEWLAPVNRYFPCRRSPPHKWCPPHNAWCSDNFWFHKETTTRCDGELDCTIAIASLGVYRMWWSSRRIVSHCRWMWKEAIPRVIKNRAKSYTYRHTPHRASGDLCRRDASHDIVRASSAKCVKREKDATCVECDMRNEELVGLLLVIICMCN